MVFFLRRNGSTKVPFPSSIMLEVTNHCNLGCITCPREYAYGDTMAKGTMILIKWQKLLMKGALC